MAAIFMLALAGCFGWSEDSQGNMRSFDLMGAPVWQSSAPAPALNPTEMGMTPEEAARMGGPVLVMPPDSGYQGWRYRWYPKGNNHCQTDVQQLLEAPQWADAAGQKPYCTEHPTEPANRKVENAVIPIIF
ncbi:MAG: hypothetical protein ACREQI_00785 [Candidatus Binataceae bacterium]